MATRAWVRNSNPDVLDIPHHEVDKSIRAQHAMHTGELRKQGIIGGADESPYVCIDTDCNAEVHKRVSSGGLSHFYHKSGTGSNCTGETIRHRQTQNIVLQFLDSDPRVAETQNNYRVGTKEADGYVKFKTGEEYYLEVVHTHDPESDVVDLFGQRMLVLDLGHQTNFDISEEDVDNDLAPAYFAQEVLAHYENVRRIKDSDSLDHRLFQLHWKLTRNQTRYAANIRRCYSTPLLEQDVDHGYVCLNCDNRRNLDKGVRWVETDWVTYWSHQNSKSYPKLGNKCNCDISDVQWSWSLDGTETHEIATGIVLTEVDISGWEDKDAVREELLRLEHLRFHVRMGNQTQQRTWEKKLAVENHPDIAFVPRPDFHFPPLRHDFRCCKILSSVRASVHGKIGSGKSIDPQESEEDLQREIDSYHQKAVEDNRVALGMLDSSVASDLRERFEDRWGILKADRDKWARINTRRKLSN